jgi:tRNA1Val (adenine37-N6)-methyltransferase
LRTRVEGLSVTGVERQADYAALARRNAEEAALPVEVVEADIAIAGPSLRQMSFDHVIANPPYFRADAGTGAQDRARKRPFARTRHLRLDRGRARAAEAPGWLTMIQNADRLPDMLASLDGFGSISVRPCNRGSGALRPVPSAGAQGRAGAVPCLRPLLVHEGAAHLRRRESYTPEVKRVLRDGAALHWPESRDRSQLNIQSIEWRDTTHNPWLPDEFNHNREEDHRCLLAPIFRN